MKRLFFVTGQSGIGKTTIILKAVDDLKNTGFKVGCMLSREVREKKTRIGFEIVDLGTEKRGWLAHLNQPEGPRVGKYRVNLRDLDNIGAGCIRNALTDAQIVVVDEIGPMELHSSTFKEAVGQTVNSDKPLLGVIHQGTRDPFIEQLRKRDDAKIFVATFGNRTNLHNLLVTRITQFLKEKPEFTR